MDYIRIIVCLISVIFWVDLDIFQHLPFRFSAAADRFLSIQKMKTLTVSLLLNFINVLSVVWGHARLVEPPSRSSMWRMGFPTATNYDDDGLYCGGISVQWGMNRGKCGICGDPWNVPHPRPNEAGGKYGRGIIVRTYQPGQVFKATVEVTANHKGYFEFRLCPNNNPKKEATQHCLDNHLLFLVESGETRLSLADGRRGKVSVSLQLPKGLTCTQCVLQWTYVAGNNWGLCKDGTSGMGCGAQETFRGCADIAIGRGRGNVSSERDFIDNTIDADHNGTSVGIRRRPLPDSGINNGKKWVTYGRDVSKYGSGKKKMKTPNAQTNTGVRSIPKSSPWISNKSTIRPRSWTRSTSGEASSVSSWFHWLR